MNEKLQNPFLAHGYVSPEYFCDREKETKELENLLQNGWNVTLISPRRMGKTGLIKNTFYHLREADKSNSYIYVDIFGSKDMHGFVEKLSEAVFDAMLSKGENFLKRATQVLSSCRPVISMDSLTGSPSVSVSIEPSSTETTLKSVLGFLKDSEKQVFIAIDEFQEITYYPEKGLEADLRSFIQFMPNTHFVFSGSKRHLMMDMFMSPKRPFYQSTRLMDLKAIAEKNYYQFALKFFKEDGCSLTENVFHKLYSRFNGHTWYIQVILKILYSWHKHDISVEDVRNAIKEQVVSSTAYYENIMNLIADKQYEVLKAVAKEHIVKEPTNGKFIHDYQLKSASSVTSAIKALVEKELLYRTDDGYIVYDRFFSLWLAER